MSSKANRRIKRKQLLLMGAVLVGLFAVAIGTSLVLDGGKGSSKTIVEKPTTKPLSVGISQADRDAAAATATGEVAALRKMIEEKDAEAAQRNRELEEKIKSLGERKESATTSTATSVPPPSQFPDATGNPFQQNGAPLAPPQARGPGSLGIPPNGKSSADGASSLLDSVVISSSTGPGRKSVEASDPLIDSSVEFGRKQKELRDGGAVDRFNRTGDDDPLSPNRGSGRSAETYIPAGTYIRGVVLHGLDAPAGGQAQQNPHPVLIQLADDAVLPNKFKSALKNCMITANGYGDISAERAYIRTDRLSCIDEDGGSVDVSLKGYVAGEDGKTGMRGRVVEKSGRILANAMLAAVGSGIGQAFKAQGTISTLTPYGTTSEQVTNGFKSGFGTGTNRAFDKLSEYYIKLAERTAPVVEINGGRVVDIVVSRGVSIERSKKTSNSKD